MKDIDELIRTEMQDAQQTPPPELWEQIASRLAQQSTSPKTRHSYRPLLIATIVLGIAAATGIFLWATSHQQPLETNSSTQSKNLDQLSAHPDTKTEITVQTPQKKHIATTQKTTTTSHTQVALADYRSTTLPQPASVSAQNQSALPEKSTSASESQLPSIPKDISSADPAFNETPDIALSQPSDLPPSVDDTTSATDKTVQQKKPITPQLFIPSLLTPNGDGINDCWVIPDLEQYGHAQVQIYTAQSQRVYSSSDYRNDFCGNGLPEGNYFYVLVLRDYNYSRRGVFVIRK